MWVLAGGDKPILQLQIREGKEMKKLLMSLLCVAMIVCFMPTMAWAAEASNENSPVEVSTYNELALALQKAADAHSGDTTISITDDIKVPENSNWSSINVDGYHGAGVITIHGNGHVITGLDAPLFSGGFARVSGLVIDELTLSEVNIKDTTNSQGIGAFVGSVDYMPIISLTGCHLINSSISSTEGARVGGLIGWTSGYNNPTYIHVENCSVKDTKITANGAVGAIIGHAGANPATYHTISNCTITGNTLESNDKGGWRVGAVIGTVNVGQVTIDGITESDNNLSQEGKTAPSGEKANLYGRIVAGNTGVLIIDGKIVDGSVDKYVAAIGGKCYESLDEAITVSQTNETVKLLADVDLNAKLTIDKPVIIDGDGHTITTAASLNDHLMLITANATVKNVSLDSANKAKGVNTYGTAKDLAFNFENVKMLNSAGNGLTAKGGTVTLDGTEISDSAWTQSVDISSSKALDNGANLVIKGNTALKDTLQVIFDEPSEGKVGTITASGWNITSEDKSFGEEATKYTKRIFTLSKLSYSGGGSATTDNVTNKPENTTAGTPATTTADINASTTTKADGTKTTTATVDNTTAGKIVDKAVANKSEEVVVDATSTAAAPAAGTTTEVALPEKTVQDLAAKTDANVTIKTDAASVALDKEAVDAVAAQAGTTGTVKLVIETIKTDADIHQVELKLVTSNGAVTDFKGGNVAVTVKLDAALNAKDVICVYIDDNGVYHKVNGQKNADGTYTFTTGHFSAYAVMSTEKAEKVFAQQDAKAADLTKALKLQARSAKTAKGNIKVTLKVNADDIKALEDLGYTVKYKYYRSTVKAAKYTAKVEKTEKTYTNTTGKKGTRYYYKARVMVYGADGQLVAKTALNQCKYACRIK